MVELPDFVSILMIIRYSRYVLDDLVSFALRFVVFLFAISPPTNAKIGSLIQVPEDKGRFRRRLSSFKGDREAVRQCFLFSNYMIIATRYAQNRLLDFCNEHFINLSDN